MATHEVPIPNADREPIVDEQEPRWENILSKIFAEANMKLRREKEVIKVMAHSIETYGLDEYLHEYEVWGRGTHERTDLHSMRAAAMMVDLALEKDLPYLEEIAAGGMLHDIGKQSVSLKILNKKERFTPDEKAVMNAHPIFGVKRLHEDPRLAGAAKARVINAMIFGHHGFKKGDPYPFNVADIKSGRVMPGNFFGFNVDEWDDDMTNAAAIASTADVFDAMAHHREYSETFDTADKILKKIIETEDLPEDLARSTTGRFFDRTAMARSAAA